MALNVSDRRTNYPDYERGAITYQAYSGGAKSGDLMGQSIPGTASARLADENLRKGMASNAENLAQSERRIEHLDGVQRAVRADHIAGNEPAFSAMFFAVYTSFKLEASALKRSLENGILQI